MGLGNIASYICWKLSESDIRWESTDKDNQWKLLIKINPIHNPLKHIIVILK